MTSFYSIEDLEPVVGEVIEYESGARYRLTEVYEPGVSAWYGNAVKIEYGRSSRAGKPVGSVVGIKRNAKVRVLIRDADVQGITTTTNQGDTVFHVKTVRTKLGWVGQVHAAFPGDAEATIVWESSPVAGVTEAEEARGVDERGAAESVAREKLREVVEGLFA